MTRHNVASISNLVVVSQSVCVAAGRTVIDQRPVKSSKEDSRSQASRRLGRKGSQTHNTAVSQISQAAQSNARGNVRAVGAGWYAGRNPSVLSQKFRALDIGPGNKSDPGHTMSATVTTSALRSRQSTVSECGATSATRIGARRMQSAPHASGTPGGAVISSPTTMWRVS